MDNRGRGPSSGPDNRGRGPSSGPDNRGRGPSDRDNNRSRRRDNDEAPEFEERVVQINRVSKVVKGGRRFSFGSLIVVGDGKGRVGFGMGKSGEVPEAIRKGVEAAKKNMITVPLDGTTIPHETEEKFGASKVFIKPALPGTGVIAGGGARAVLEAAGIKDVLTKAHGANNRINIVQATIKALQGLESSDAIRQRRRRDRPIRRPQSAAARSIIAQAEATPTAPTDDVPVVPSTPRELGQRTHATEERHDGA